MNDLVAELKIKQFLMNGWLNEWLGEIVNRLIEGWVSEWKKKEWLGAH